VLFDFGSKAHDIGVIEELRNLYPQVKVLVLTTHMEHECANNAIRAGANGYIYKMVNIAELQEAIVRVNNSQRVFDEEIQFALTN
jgi:DNA-binding NarL/FixJ family response regulator